MPWTQAHAPEIAPHGLAEGQMLEGPWYPQVYPNPLPEEHRPLVSSKSRATPWGLLTLLGVAKESQDILMGLGIETENCTLPSVLLPDVHGDYVYYGFDGPLVDCDNWQLLDQLPLHKYGQMLKQMMMKKEEQQQQ